MKTSGNTIFIPGATSGIGLALAVRLHDAGNTVIVGGRRQRLLDEIAAQHPGIEGVAIDTSDAASIVRVSAEVIERWPATNVVIAMAGIMRPERVLSPDFLATAEATIVTNLLGPLRLVAAFTEHLQSKPDAAIVTVSSGLAFVPLPATPTYSATKAAIHSLSISLRQQFAATSVEVLELAPPAVQTELMGQSDNPEYMPLDEFADEVMALLAGPAERGEILVERVKPLRFAEINGSFEQVFAMLAARS